MPDGEAMTVAQMWGIWVAALLTLAVYSFLYKDNPAYRFGEALFVGISAGYGVAVIWRTVILVDLIVPIREDGEWIRILPAILGLMMLARFIPKATWLSRWPMAFTIGMYAGMGIPATLEADVLKQMQATLVPPVVLDAPTTFGCVLATFSNLVLILGVLAVLAYFFFSKQHTGTYGRFCKIGVYFLMFSFGATFGYTVMARISLLIGRVGFLLYEWWPLVHG